VDREALECPHCGVPVLAMLGPRTTKMHPGVIVMLVVTGGLGLLMVLGIAAALVIPQMVDSGASSAYTGEELVEFEAAGSLPVLAAADSAIVREGIRGLWTAYNLQADHQIETRRYTENLDELPGWRDPRSGHYGFAVSEWGAALCVNAVQKNASAHPLSIDGVGIVHYGHGCGGEPFSEYPDREWLAAD